MIRIETGQEMDETTLAALASGRADPAVALFLDCVMELRGLSDVAGEAIAGASLEAEAFAEMADDALDRAFAAIDRGEAGSARAPAAPRYPELIRIPAALRARIAEAEAADGWRMAGPGIHSLGLDTGGAVKAELLRIGAGAATPRHTHKGREYTLCLVGGFSDHRGSYGPGDVAVGDPDVTHQPRADEDGPCFVLAITDGDLVFGGVLGLLQKWFAR